MAARTELPRTRRAADGVFAGRAGRIARRPKLAALARKAHATPAQLALAFLLAQPDVIVIPKATQPAHISSRTARPSSCSSTPRLRDALDAAFPPPSRATPLADQLSATGLLSSQVPARH
jgi:diketogulonate reductase-like aldo/keto reductase